MKLLMSATWIENDRKVEQHIMTGSCIIYCTKIVSVLTEKSIPVLFTNSRKIL